MEKRSFIVENNLLIYGRSQKSTSIRPAKLDKKASSSRFDCFNIWFNKEINIPITAIRKIK